MASEASPPPVDEDERARSLRPILGAGAGTGAADELPIDVELIKVLASDSRRDILRILGKRRHTLTELAEALGLKKATVLEHLQKLVAAGLIKRMDEDDRLWVYYDLSPRGKRLVRPERTRFYLILGGTAIAAVLLGAIVAAAMFGSFGGSPSSADDARSPAKSFEDQAGVLAPPVIWRGLDDDVALQFDAAPSGASILLSATDGSATSVPVFEHVARLDAADIDALHAGTYTLSLRTEAGETPLPTTIEVLDPEIAVFPLVVRSTDETVEVAIAPPDRIAPERVAANGALYGDVSRFTMQPDQDGRIAVGRLSTTQLTLLPDIQASLEKVDTQLHAKVRSGSGPIPDAEIVLEGASLGRTNETGELLAPWPGEGERALRIVAPGGSVQDHDILFTNDTATEQAPRLTIEALDARVPPSTTMRLRADVRNAGNVEELVTVTARQDGALLASTLVRVPPNGRAEALLEAPLARPDVVDVTAHAARASFAPMATHTTVSDASGDGDRSGGSSNTTAGPAPPQASAAYSPNSSENYTSMQGRIAGYMLTAVAPADASDRIYLAQPTAATMAPDAAGSQAAAPSVPGPEPLLALIAVGALALALRRRGR
ncbi:MAG TPA: winged helix-turn-helix domain-containing protein [Candidatus Thermoplasmatota archaeon]|nr:winged helix-turn-helix domain-containing protein [Candidatus Thermoplasmatota archaeon]